MQQEPVDIMHYHISPNGHFNGKWSEAHKYYRGIMRDPHSVNFITVMREPRSHFLRYLVLLTSALISQRPDAPFRE